VGEFEETPDDYQKKDAVFEKWINPMQLIAIYSY